MPIKPTANKPPETFADKKAARSWARALLRSISPGDRAAWSASAAACVLRSEAFRRCDLVLAFLSMPLEIDTADLIRAAFQEGKQVASPRLEGTDIVFAPLDEAWEALPRDTLGIPTPSGDIPSLTLKELSRKNVFVLVPGLLFDARGGRLGRGKGYYDRFLGAALEAMERAGESLEPQRGFFVPCGFCFQAQLVAQVPMGESDKRVPLLATEEGLVSTG